MPREMTEWDWFSNWLQSTTGKHFLSLGVTPQNYKESSLYGDWIWAGKPKFGYPESKEVLKAGVETRFTPEEITRLPRDEEAPIPTEVPEEEAPVAGEVPFPDVVSRGGYDFMPIYDLEGNIVGYERIGETPTTEADKLSAWERAQLGLSEAELGLSYAQLEEERQARLAGLMAQPSDWIKRWYAMQSGQYPEAPRWDKEGFRNPYAAYLQKYNPDRLRELVEQGYAPRESLTEPLAKFGEPYPEAGTYQAGPVWAPPAEGQRIIKVSPEGGVEVTSEPAPMGRFGQVTRPEAQEPPPFRPSEFVTKTRKSEVQQPSAPPTPDWLAQFAPWLTTGEPISPGAIPTPSGQLWGRTPWSVREGLRGFAEFAGGRPLIDIEEHLAMMLPEEPRGAGYGRWRPAMQV